MSADIVRTARLELVPLTAECLAALLAGDTPRAAAISGMDMPAGYPSEHEVHWMRIRHAELLADAALQPWLTRGMRLCREPQMVGHVGFHGYPDAQGVAELGYTVFEPHRRLGYATEAVRGLMDWARSAHGVRTFRLSIAPENEPSLAIAHRLNFVETGSQIDDVDGLELVFLLTDP